jgi:hypothetical protein
VEEELEAAEERVKTSEAYVDLLKHILRTSFFLFIEKSHCSKIVEREDELFIVQNIVKSLEVSEEKVSYNALPKSLFAPQCYFPIIFRRINE